MIANQIALFVVTVLGNGTAGGPFVYVSAYAFFQLPHGLLAVSLATTFAPELAIVASRGDLTALRAQLSRGLRLTAIVVAPAAAIYLGLARPIVVALLERGAFSAHDAVQVADTLAAFSVGLLPFSLYLFALRAFTSRLDTRTPFLINCVENVVNIVLAFPLYAWLGIPGLALAFSLAYFVGAGVAFVVLHRDLDGIDGRRLASTILRAVIAAAAVAGVTWAIARGIGSSGTGEAILTTVLGVAAGAAVYFLLLLLFRVDELRILATLLPRTTTPARACNDHSMGIRVVTDSACDLPAPLVEALAIEVVPLTIRFGEEEFVDQVELSAAEFWDRVERTDKLPETAAPSPGAFEARYRHLMERGATGIVCINLSSHLSGTMQSAQVAAAAVAAECPVQVIDSQSASMGQGQPVPHRRAARGRRRLVGVDRRGGRRPSRSHQAVRVARHARPHPQERTHRQRTRAPRVDAVDQTDHRDQGGRRRRGREGAHAFEGAQRARVQSGRAEDRASRGAARERSRPRGVARPPRPDLPA